jgi:hypothetical protein
MKKLQKLFWVISIYAIPYIDNCFASKPGKEVWQQLMQEMNNKKSRPLPQPSVKKSTKLETPKELYFNEVLEMFKADMRERHVAPKVRFREEFWASHKEPIDTRNRLLEILYQNPLVVAVLQEDEPRPLNTLGEQYTSVMGKYALYNSEKTGNLIPSSNFTVVFSREKD